jgi:uncharacterized protein YndB with AHSA1/START domain
MFTIEYSRDVSAPVEKVWAVLCDTSNYQDWNPFVLSCDSTFEPGTPIRMKVRLTPRIVINQKEKIIANREGEYLEYGINIPPGLLRSSRQHRLQAIGEGATLYESVFILEGLLAPVVQWLLGDHLMQGFLAMTDALVQRSQA